MEVRVSRMRTWRPVAELRIVVLRAANVIALVSRLSRLLCLCLVFAVRLLSAEHNNVFRPLQNTDSTSYCDTSQLLQSYCKAPDTLACANLVIQETYNKHHVYLARCARQICSSKALSFAILCPVVLTVVRAVSNEQAVLRYLRH